MSRRAFHLKIDGSNPTLVQRYEIEAAINYYDPPNVPDTHHDLILLACAQALLEQPASPPPTGESTMVTNPDDKPDPNPEITLAKLMGDDLGVAISPQALRLFIRWRWGTVRRLAHLIHGSTP